MSQDKGNRRTAAAAEESLYRIPPYFYVHVLDQNTNVTQLHVGPKTYIRQDNERLAYYFFPTSCFYDHYKQH